MDKTFCYITFYPFYTVHLTKDTEIIPELIGRLPEWHAQINRFNHESLLHQEQEVPHVEITNQKTRKIRKIVINL